jgi:hypothetical protein
MGKGLEPQGKVFRVELQEEEKGFMPQGALDESLWEGVLRRCLREGV